MTLHTPIANLVCWQCGAALTALTPPLLRLDECPSCRADLHVCKLCAFYDVDATDQCREDDAEAVLEKTRANFCAYFQPRADAYAAGARSKAVAAKAQLDNLFGDNVNDANKNSAADDARRALDDLFGDKQ